MVGVGVLVGVSVIVGVGVLVGVSVFVGVTDGVLVGDGDGGSKQSSFVVQDVSKYTISVSCETY